MDINNASRKFATGINTTNGKFATSFNYTCHKITNSDNNTNIPKISLSPSKNKFTNSALILFNLVVV
jgi:predicted porin